MLRVLSKKHNSVTKFFFVPLFIFIVWGISVFSVSGQGNPDGSAEVETEDIEFSEVLPPIPDDLTGGKPWIDSCIPGNITADTVSSPNDDFYTWVNKDWIVSSKIPEGAQFLDFDVFAEGRARVRTALAGDELSDHDAHQIQLLFHAFVDTDAREAAGCDPARQVIDSIRSISDIDELNAFLLDIERSAGVPTLIKVENKRSYSEHRWKTRVGLSNATFGSTRGTLGMDAVTTDPDSDVYRARYALVHNILSRLGWTDEEAKTAFEGRLAVEKEIIRITGEAGEEQEGSASFIIGQLNGLAGKFPPRELAETRGYGKAETFEVLDAAELHAVGELYTDEHLDDLRNYFICGYLLEAGSWLDTEAFDAWLADYEAIGYYNSLTMPERNESIEDTAVNLASVVVPSLVGRAYVEAYDLSHTKEFIKSLCIDAIEAHKAIVNGSRWLSDASKQKLIGKLDAITMNVVYPDVWEDYSGLDLEGLDYYEARRAVWLNDLARNAGLTGTEIDDRLWDEPTLIEGGGAYDAFTNSFHVDAGIVEKEAALYAAGEISLETLLGGKTGYVIFHELAHALDPGSIYFDAEGEYADGSLLEPSEFGEYMRRAEKIRNYLDGISLWEEQYLDGSVSMQEAIAEICGMQARLKYAEGKDGFDYRTFFEKRAQMGPYLHTPEYELEYVMGLDHHPTAYIDTNMTVQQFDEFMEAFEVKPGDTMYLAPEDRLVIW